MYGDPGKIEPLGRRLSRSLNVIGTDTRRSATYDLTDLYSNSGLSSYHIRDNSVENR